MRKIFRVVGMITWYGAGAFMFIFWLGAMSRWLGCFGVFLAFILCPGAIIFPIIFWIVEGFFPVTYFAIWGVGIIGMIVFSLASEE